MLSSISLYFLLTTWLICCVWFPLVSSTENGDAPVSRDSCSFAASSTGIGDEPVAPFTLDTSSDLSINGDTVMPPMNAKEKLSRRTDRWYLSESANSFTGDAVDYWKVFDCKALFSHAVQRPIPDASTWQFLRGVYLGVVGPDLSTIATQDLFRVDGFEVPVKVVQIPGKGRGVIALQDIPEGTMVWDDIFTARFPSPTLYRRFLACLPQDLACDIMLWVYVEDYPEVSQDDSAKSTTTPRPTISVDLDAGSLLNTVSGDEMTSQMHPVTYITNRLIKAGEELILDYRDFEKQGSWDAAGFSKHGKDHLWF